MSVKSQTYLEEQLEAVVETDHQSLTILFQREKIKADAAEELELLQAMESAIKRDIHLTEDELRLVLQIPSNYLTFSKLKKKDLRSRWIFSSQLLKLVKSHPYSRLHPVVCPENIVADESLSPHLLHYGVSESLPPYETNQEKLWMELKATIAAAVDGNRSFRDYLSLYETIELSPAARDVIKAKDESELSEVIRTNIEMLEKKDKEYVKVPQKKWKATRFSAWGLLIALLPFLAFSLYSLIFTQPKQAAFINSQEHFLKSQYSEVVSELSNYDIDQMPRVVQYELAQSYIINEALTEDQKENVQNTITLQTDPLYYHYWIHIGRGDAKEALDISRDLEDRDLILFALLKYREVVKADDKLESEEKQQKIDEIQAEIDEYLEEQKAQEEEERSNSGDNEQAVEQEPEKEAEKETKPADEKAAETSAEKPDEKKEEAEKKKPN
ncbi:MULTISPECIES: type VII secretion protein EssB [unclassified Cytobacillus]|uniref:type VII secretion protein EssB n=1 Tax=unclassified Cytobacillus TaxID=2675268 RepID=UPI002041D809|nr:type VII secretion protein EssB [Cytobacillus sp. AMY 15.2]MCM3093767.1 type VII secretion protein EssB [Cytobacillus sp. AMY 15.2]